MSRQGLENFSTNALAITEIRTKAQPEKSQQCEIPKAELEELVNPKNIEKFGRVVNDAIRKVQKNAKLTPNDLDEYKIYNAQYAKEYRLYNATIRILNKWQQLKEQNQIQTLSEDLEKKRIEARQKTELGEACRNALSTLLDQKTGPQDAISETSPSDSNPYGTIIRIHYTQANVENMINPDLIGGVLESLKEQLKKRYKVLAKAEDLPEESQNKYKRPVDTCKSAITIAQDFLKLCEDKERPENEKINRWNEITQNADKMDEYALAANTFMQQEIVQLVRQLTMKVRKIMPSLGPTNEFILRDSTCDLPANPYDTTDAKLSEDPLTKKDELFPEDPQTRDRIKNILREHLYRVMHLYYKYDESLKKPDINYEIRRRLCEAAEELQNITEDREMYMDWVPRADGYTQANADNMIKPNLVKGVLESLEKKLKRYQKVLAKAEDLSEKAQGKYKRPVEIYEGAVQILNDFKQSCEDNKLSDDEKKEKLNVIIQKAYERTTEAHKYAVAMNTLAKAEIEELGKQCQDLYDTTLAKLSQESLAPPDQTRLTRGEIRVILAAVRGSDHFTVNDFYLGSPSEKTIDTLIRSKDLDKSIIKELQVKGELKAANYLSKRMEELDNMVPTDLQPNEKSNNDPDLPPDFDGHSNPTRCTKLFDRDLQGRTMCEKILRYHYDRAMNHKDQCLDARKTKYNSQRKLCEAIEHLEFIKSDPEEYMKWFNYGYKHGKSLLETYEAGYLEKIEGFRQAAFNFGTLKYLRGQLLPEDLEHINGQFRAVMDAVSPLLEDEKLNDANKQELRTSLYDERDSAVNLLHKIWQDIKDGKKAIDEGKQPPMITETKIEKDVYKKNVYKVSVLQYTIAKYESTINKLEQKIAEFSEKAHKPQPQESSLDLTEEHLEQHREQAGQGSKTTIRREKFITSKFKNWIASLEKDDLEILQTVLSDAQQGKDVENLTCLKDQQNDTTAWLKSLIDSLKKLTKDDLEILQTVLSSAQQEMDFPPFPVFED